MLQYVRDRQQVYQALGEVLAWPEMARSPQLAKFLNYIVRRTLEGEQDSIKAYSIAVDVFGRSQDFDPQSDPIVRVQARRLRSLLETYYNTVGQSAAVRIHLPVGRYRPEFEAVGPLPVALTVEPEVVVASEGSSAEVSGFEGTNRSAWIALAVMGTIFLGLAFFFVSKMASTLAPNEASQAGLQSPSLTIFEFQDLTGDKNELPLLAGLAVELVTDLEQFGDIEIAYAAGGISATSGLEGLETDYALTGIATISRDKVQYSVVLTNTASKLVIWSEFIAVERAESLKFDKIDSISRSLSLVLGSSRGPLHAAGRDRASRYSLRQTDASPYVCLMLFHRYRDTAAAEDRSKAAQCYAGLPEADQKSATAMAVGAILLAAEPEANDDMALSQLAKATEQMQSAVQLAPVSGLVWGLQGELFERQGARQQARNSYASALQLNPADADVIARFARLVALDGNLDSALEMSDEAIKQAPRPTAWYFCVPTLAALRAANFELALSNAKQYAEADKELGPVLAVLAALGAGNASAVNRYLLQVLETPRFRAGGIIPVLGHQIADEALLVAIADGLKRAGVSPSALAGAF